MCMWSPSLKLRWLKPSGVRGSGPSLGLLLCRARPSPSPSLVCFPAGTGGTMGSRRLRLVLVGGLLLAFACGPVLGRVPRGLQEPPEQEWTKEPLLDYDER